VVTRVATDAAKTITEADQRSRQELCTAMARRAVARVTPPQGLDQALTALAGVGDSTAGSSVRDVEPGAA